MNQPVYYKDENDNLLICPVNDAGEYFMPEVKAKTSSIILMEKLTHYVDQFHSATMGKNEEFTDTIAEHYADHLHYILEIE